MAMPDRLQTIVGAFRSAPKPLRLQLLLEYSRKLPPLPERLREDRAGLEQVHECQTPIFVGTELDDDERVRIHFDAPEEAPTTRGFAGILWEGLDGESADAVLGVPIDFYEGMGLAEVISPLRLRGMQGMLGRLKRQVEERRQSA